MKFIKPFKYSENGFDIIEVPVGECDTVPEAYHAGAIAGGYAESEGGQVEDAPRLNKTKRRTKKVVQAEEAQQRAAQKMIDAADAVRQGTEEV